MAFTGDFKLPPIKLQRKCNKLHKACPYTHPSGEPWVPHCAPLRCTISTFCLLKWSETMQVNQYLLSNFFRQRSLSNFSHFVCKMSFHSIFSSSSSIYSASHISFTFYFFKQVTRSTIPNRRSHRWLLPPPTGLHAFSPQGSMCLPLPFSSLYPSLYPSLFRRGPELPFQSPIP